MNEQKPGNDAVIEVIDGMIVMLNKIKEVYETRTRQIIKAEQIIKEQEQLIRYYEYKLHDN